jgi:hypothetical protein
MESLLLGRERSIALLIPTKVLATLTFLYSRWQRHMDAQAFKKKHGCKAPPQYPHEDKRYGSDLIRIRMDATKEGRLFRLYESQFELYGKTFEENWMGKR